MTDGTHFTLRLLAAYVILGPFGRHARYASEQATELKDADTADIFTEVARGIDKWLWFVETSQQSGS
jgi:starvation-inducible DNA-binding protein